MFGAHFLVDLDNDGGLGRQLDFADDLLGMLETLGVEINGAHWAHSLRLTVKASVGYRSILYLGNVIMFQKASKGKKDEA